MVEIAGCLIVAALMLTWQGASAAEDYGAEGNPTGDPIGGGKGYSRIVTQGDCVVGTAEELLAALQRAKAGEVVLVASDAEIDLSEQANTGGVAIPAGVILAGNRGQNGAAGPLLKGPGMAPRTGLLKTAKGVRVTGLRIQGPDFDFPEIDYDRVPRSFTRGVSTGSAGEGLEVDNCEIMNFHHSGVNVSARGAHVHHCFIHDVHAYPVCVGGVGDPLIEANLIYWIWHTIASTGQPETGYEARYNLAVRCKPPESWGPGHKSHGFDVHQYRQALPRLIAGDWVKIHHNTMVDLGPAYGTCIRGVPRRLADIHHNWFSTEDPEMMVRQLDPPGNLWVHDNVCGEAKAHVPVGPQTTPRIGLRHPPPPSGEAIRIDGDLTVDLEVEAFPGRRITQVTIRIDERDIYSAALPPGKEQVLVAAGDIASGSHELELVATDDSGATATQSVTITKGD